MQFNLFIFDYLQNKTKKSTPSKGDIKIIYATPSKISDIGDFISPDVLHYHPRVSDASTTAKEHKVTQRPGSAPSSGARSNHISGIKNSSGGYSTPKHAMNGNEVKSLSAQFSGVKSTSKGKLIIYIIHMLI